MGSESEASAGSLESSSREVEAVCIKAVHIDVV